MIFNHRVIRRLQQENETPVTLIVAGVSYSLGTAYKVHLYPVSSSVAFEASGLEMSRPHVLMWEPGDRDRFPIGALVEESRGMFMVSTPSQHHEFGNQADHSFCFVNLMEIEPEGIQKLHIEDNFLNDNSESGGVSLATGVSRPGGDPA